MPPDTAPPPAPTRGQRTRRAAWGYLLGVSTLALVFRWQGEELWALWILLYLPAGTWLLPLLALVPLAWQRCRGALWILAAATAVVFWMAGGNWLPKPPPEPGASTALQLSVVSYNIGEDNGTSALPFVKAHQPDFFLIQCTAHTSRQRSRYESPQPEKTKIHRRSVGRFELQSLHPIRSGTLLRHPGLPKPYGARFEVDWQGQSLTLYSIHMLTPRADFMLLSGQRSGEKPLSERWQLFRQSIALRQEVVTSLLAQIQSTAGPVIVAGDFNMPAWGRFYQRFSAELTDSFATVGHGFGYTFPAYDPYIPTPLGPWLRLDYIFSNAALTPVRFEVERQRPSQHRAIYASFILLSTPSLPTP